jgi:hypothetical protein
VLRAILEIIAAVFRIIPGWKDKRTQNLEGEWRHNRKLLTAICVVSLGGCATTTPVTKTSGAVEELMKDPNYEQVRQSTPQSKNGLGAHCIT